jgi:hypothetical protein
MANVFKRLVGTPTRRARKKGNLTRGIGTENFGPTSQTGYYASAIPPSNGYLITSLNGNNLPEYRVANNDNELIQFARDLGGNPSNSDEAKSYLRGRPDTWFIDSSLILDLDFSNEICYPGSGTTYYDLSGNKYNAVSSTNTSYVEYDSTLKAVNFKGGEVAGHGLFIQDLHYISGNSDQLEELTIDTLIKNSSTSNNSSDQRIILSFDRSAVFRFSVGGDAGEAVSNPGKLSFMSPQTGDRSAINCPDLRDNKWHRATVTFKSGVGNGLRYYVDGVLVHTDTSNYNPIGDHYDTETPRYGVIGAGSEKTNDIPGGSTAPDALFTGSMAEIKYYKKALTETEVKNNFYKGPIVTENLILHLDPANPVCFEPGQDVCYNTVTGGILTGANGTPGSGIHTPNPNNFPAHNSVYGGVFDFVGGKGMNVDEDLGFTTTRTLSMWIYKNSTSTQYFTDARNDGGSWFLSNYSSRNITYTNNTSYNYGSSYNSSHPDFINKWIHLTITSDSSGGKIYLNGEEVNSYVSSTSIDEDFGKNFRIGTRYTTSTQWTGYMGPIVAYNRVLSAGEVKQNFNAHRSRYGI